MLALRRNDPVLSAATSWSDLRATAHGEVLEVTRRRGEATRRLVVSFGDGGHAIEGTRGARVLVVSGAFDGGRLAPRSAVVLASD